MGHRLMGHNDFITTGGVVPSQKTAFPLRMQRAMT